MPANLAASIPTGVLPNGLFTAFSESRVYPMLSQSYHDGTQERSLITDGVNPADSIKRWTLSVRRTAANIATLRTFYESHFGPLKSFYFYNPFEPQDGHAVGTNWDGTGASTYGRHVVKFTNQSWMEVCDISRTNVSIELQEVA